jgi:hypothetical protein
MSGSRPSIFDDKIGDLSGFAPKAGPEPDAVPSQTSRRIAEEGGFHSRAPVLRPPAAARPSSPKTGRTVLLNARITQRAHDRFHEIVAAEHARYETGEIMHRVTLGEIVERALQALDREMLKREKKGQGT